MSETTTASPRLDVTIVGAGILGLATARELLQRNPRLRLTVLERELAPAVHQTGRNSGVVHAGIYYQPGSLKARLCVAGARDMVAYCESRDVPIDRCGKLIVAVDSAELARLDELEHRGRMNGVHGLRRLSASAIPEHEPSCRGLGALHSPNTSIVDYGLVAQRLADDVQAAGGSIQYGIRVEEIREHARSLTLLHPAGTVETRNLISCAGPWADRVAALAGAGDDPRIVPFRGQYLRLRPHAEHLVQGLIYPVPDPALPFLGVHLTRHIAGGVLLGPTALIVGARDAHRLTDVRLRDIADTILWPGTWRVMSKFSRAGLRELRLAASRRSFVRACARLVPDLTVGDVMLGPSGVRAQAVTRKGALVDDFSFSQTPHALHVRNAPSPAATASLSIAGVIADQAEHQLGLAR